MSKQTNLRDDFANELSDDIHLLGDILGKVIRQQAGIDLFGLEERLRALTKARRADSSDVSIDRAIERLVGNLTLAESENIARAFTTYFDLVNLAEANQRVRVLRDRERESYPHPLKESIHDAVNTLWEHEVSPHEMQALVDALHVELVFTAHPTEAKRRTLLSKLKRIGRSLYDLDTRNLTPREKEDLVEDIQSEVTSLWITQRSRSTKPLVSDEVKTGLYHFEDTIWDTIPDIYESMRDALAQYYPTVTAPSRFLFFGSWTGGDRDGNPFVTPEVTAETLRLHRGLAARKHQQSAQVLNRTLSVSERLSSVSPKLVARLEEALKDPSERVAFLSTRYPNEPYRLLAAVLAADLGDALNDRIRSRLLKLNNDPLPSLKTKQDLLAPLNLMDEGLRDANANAVADADLIKFRVQGNVFGMSTARLDIRNSSEKHTSVVGELMEKLNIADGYESANSDTQLELLTSALANPIPNMSTLSDLSPLADETVGLFDLLQRTVTLYGVDTIGPYVISMTATAVHVLEVLLLSYWHGLSLRPDGTEGIAIAPLFETRADLEAAPDVLAQLFNHPAYSKHLAALHKEQCIMIGYSDSNKDAGYLAATWELYLSQEGMAKACQKDDVQLILFHGRGGTIARGGGPMNRAIMAQPPNSINGRIRITEQGEVLYRRYANNTVARRHLEQVVHAVMMSSLPITDTDVKPEWRNAMTQLAPIANDAYRKFIYETPMLIEYWQEATPLKELSKMQIGSRPAKRANSGDPFAFLRAIPWVFSWMQSRHNLPGWYGLGAAIDAFVSGNDDNLELLREMYTEWIFFKQVIDNAQRGMGQADMGIARHYANLVQDEEVRETVYAHILDAYQQTRFWILRITGQREILDDFPVLQTSTRRRNPYVDPLNFIQIRLLRDYRALEDKDSDEAKALLDRIFLTINGIAGGLKNTG